MKSKSFLSLPVLFTLGVSLVVLWGCKKEELATLTTMAVSEITFNSAKSGGNITNDGGGEITSRGVVWATNGSPSVEQHLGITREGGGAGVFTSIITNLLPGTTYYVRAYAVNGAGTAYGNQVSFTTSASLPSVTTNNALEITTNSAKVGGSVTDDGGGPVTARGIAYSTSQDPTTSGNVVSAGSGTGSFTAELSGLSQGTTYYARAFATNSAGTAFGNQVSFTTSASLPTVTTSSASEITTNSAKVGGDVADDGGGPVTARGVVYGTSQNPTTSDNTVNAGSGTGSFVVGLTGLSPGAAYYAKAFATNSAGTAYGNQVTFTTINPPVANFTGSPTSGTAPLTVSFTDLSANEPTSWSWNFGDGTTSTQRNPSKTYSNPGTYTVSLTASNSHGSNTHNKNNFIVVSPPPPVAKFSANPTSGTAPLTVRFTDQSTNEPTSWSWNFGDGTTSTQRNPSKTYNSPGTYTVSLTASNSHGSNTHTKNNYITVTQAVFGDWPRDNQTQVVDVTNPKTGRTWMDRNLGAVRAATSSTDAQAYGDLYQWGRAADGHQKRTSVTTSTLSSSNTPGHGNFILAPGSPYDWRSPQNPNLWQGVNGINNPCPPGYRLPTNAELSAERLSWSSDNSAGAFASPLKMPLAGFRSNSSGSLISEGSESFFWSSTVSDSRSRYLRFSSTDASMGDRVRARGTSVRCIKD